MAGRRKGKRKRSSTRLRLTLSNDPRAVLQPKLRMIANGSAGVNLLRAEQISALTVSRPPPRRTDAPTRSDDAAVPVEPGRRRNPPKFRRAQAARNVRARVFVDLKEGRAAPARKGLLGSAVGRGRQLAGDVAISALSDLARDPNVERVELADALNDPKPVSVARAVAAPRRRRFGNVAEHKDGKGVLIGIIDVLGFDFAHPEFLDGSSTRFLEIWDQGGTNRPGPGRFGYGSLISRKQMNAAIAASRRVGAPATELEPQSQMVVGSHGTHVAGIAAGASGVCPKAEIAAVLVAMAPDDGDPRKSFYDSTRIVHAIEYLDALARKRDLPLSINISLGTNGHAHDGSSATSRWIDALLTSPGRSICVAAGNAGQDRAETEDDMGYAMGRIHTSGRIAARGLTSDIGWVVVGNGIADVSENELEIWYNPQDRFAVEVRTPDGVWTRPVEPGRYIENEPLPNGTFLSVYNELYHPANGANCIAVYLSPPLSPGGRLEGVAPGTWTVRLSGLDVRDGSYHGWIERDDPRSLGVQGGDRQLWNFPSFFAGRSNVDRYSVSSLACGHNVVSVANLDEMGERINLTSSQGPTRDGRFKPDVCATGTDIVAANGFAGEDNRWISMTGTSMASPFVAGVIGLMLAARPGLTAPQILALLRRTAQPLSGSDYAWRDDAGFGIVNPEAALADTLTFDGRKEVKR
jgi:subtilisin family serine protease